MCHGLLMSFVSPPKAFKLLLFKTNCHADISCQDCCINLYILVISDMGVPRTQR